MMAPHNPLARLSAEGQSVWIDYLSRDLFESGELARVMREDAVVGVTSNPSIYEKAISQGSAYDTQLKDVLTRERDPKEVFYQLVARDMESATDLLRPVWEDSGHIDGYVSWEVDPTLAYDREVTVAEATRLHEWVAKPNLYVKIPATKQGVGAIEDMIAAGKNINVTLTFSLERHQEVVEAYVRGLERLVAAGGDPSTVHSVASFFVSRVDTETDKRLETIGSPHALALRGRLAIANAKLAYQQYKQAFSRPRWKSLESLGAAKQRCLWASTSTKNPAYRDVLYFEELIGPETVNTMPEETVRAFQDHGNVAQTLEQDLVQARRLLSDLQRVGVDYDDVVSSLEREGVAKFTQSYTHLLESIGQKRSELAAA
jgi:transaldolase